jgi:REP-associated tyrosine transposase
MARLPRVVAIGGPHHVTQRANGRSFILVRDTDRQVYLDLLNQSLALHDVAMLGYCLMSNHVHLILVPSRAESLGLSLKHAHGRYASYWNAVHQSSGHVWQGRYYSCPLDDVHLWEALRYTELNPVRAGLATEPQSWLWSSAAVHLGVAPNPEWLSLDLWRGRWNATNWKEFLWATQEHSALTAIRTSTHTGRPLGSADFVRTLERSTQRLLAPQKRGRRPKAIAESRQDSLLLGA